MLPPSSSISPGAADSPAVIACRSCGHPHRAIALAPRQRALCVRCGALLGKRGVFGGDAALAFALTGLALAVPATLLPFVTVTKLRAEHVGFLSHSVTALWDHGMRLLAIWVFLCGVLAPLVLFAALVGLLLPAKLGRPVLARGFLSRIAHVTEHWAMPEVLVLAVLVALIKLGSIVGVTIGPGFWCYVAMSVMLLLGWRSFDLELPNSSGSGNG